MKKKTPIINFLAALLVSVTMISFAYETLSNSDVKADIENVIFETKDKIYNSLSIEDRKTKIENTITETKDNIYELLSNSELKIRSNIKNFLFETKEKIDEIVAKLDFAQDTNTSEITNQKETQVNYDDISNEKELIEFDSEKDIDEKNETLIESIPLKEDTYTKKYDNLVEQNSSKEITKVTEDLNTTKKEKVDLPMEKTKIVEIVETTSIEDKNSFKAKFLSSNNKYTINIATVANMKESKKFTRQNSIEDNSFAFVMGKKKKYVKILYGIYDSSKEAKKAMSTLSSRLLRNSPTIQKINKNQELYYKYNKDH